MKTFKVEVRNSCKICNTEIERPSRYRTYCSKKCREKRNYIKYRKYQKEWSQKKRAEYSSLKKKCIICGGWYVQVGSHIIQRHKITAREYREIFHLPVKRGITPGWYRKIKKEITLTNKTYFNLLKGKATRYKKGDPRTKLSAFWKSRRYTPDEYYE